MSFQHGKSTKILASEFDLSGYLNNTDLTWDVDVPETTVYGNDDRTYITGLRGGTISFGGFFDATSAITVDPVVSADLGNTSPILVTYAPAGLTVGNITYSVQSFETNYTVSSPVDGVVSISLDVQNHQKMSRGVSLHNLTARSSDGSATVVDQSSATSNGGVGFLHVTGITLPASASLAVAVQDSPTSSPGTWADLIAFTSITSSTKTAERKTASGSVDRYVRAEWAGSPTSAIEWTATFAVTFERS